LAILGLLDILAVPIAAIAVIAIGIALLVGGGTLAARFQRPLTTWEGRLAPAVVSETIAGYSTLTLSLVALLGFGVSILLTGTSIASRMMTVFYR
jgi:hypothetical protein